MDNGEKTMDVNFAIIQTIFKLMSDEEKAEVIILGVAVHQGLKADKLDDTITYVKDAHQVLQGNVAPEGQIH
jgi:hypothetical protein